MNPDKPKNNKKGTKTDKPTAKNSGSAGTSAPKQSEKIKQLQDEITGLKAQLNIYRYNMDPIQLEEKSGISEENLVNMLRNEIMQLRTKLAKCTSENTVKSNDKELREKLVKSEKEKKDQAVEISQKDNEITKLNKQIQEMKSLESVRKKDIAQNRQTSSPSQNARHELDVDIGKKDKCELQEKQSDINKLEKEIKQLKNDNDDLKQKLFQYENKMKEEENNLKFESKAQKHDNEILKQHASEIDKMKETIKGLNEDLQTANESMKQQTETLIAETESIKTKKKKIENDCSSLREQLKVKETQMEAMKTSSANTDISTKTADELQKKIDEINDFKNKLTDAESNIQGLKREKESLERNLHQEKNQRAKNEQKIEKLKEEHKNLIDEKDETIKKLRKEKTIDQTKNSGKTNPVTVSLEEKFKNAQEEIDELKNRLSKVVGANIMNDNPNITDLSDENRPTKLSEKFSELYDNEWTDAYEEAEKEFKTEEKGIAHLYKTLLDVFEFCKTKSEEHAKHIRDSVMTLPNAQKVRPKSAAIGVTNQRQLKEVRKSFAPMLIESVFQNYVSEKNLNFTKKENTGKFIKKCVEICWLMNSQDPPVILDTSVVDGKSFDVDKFRTYTKTGKLVDYVVWPPMLLHKGGPMLCKGVAQGK